MLRLQRNNADISSTRDNSTDDVVTQPLFQSNSHARESGKESREVVWQVGTDCVVIGEHCDMSSHPLRIREKVGAHLVNLSQTASSMLNQNLARRRQGNTSRMPAQKRDANRILEILDSKTSGRRRKVAALCTPRDVARFGNCNDDFKVGQVKAHVFASSECSS